MAAAQELRGLSANKDIVVALTGNPNVGKTSMFNNLTGARQHVGNWPGVTVEKKEGRLVRGGLSASVVDLPGIYGIGAYSEDERIARDFIVNEQPDVIINIVDATNLERNLYLTIQMLEMGANIVVAFNMSDEAGSKGIKVDAGKMSRLLGVPIIPTVASKNKGTDELIEAAASAAQKKAVPLVIDYGEKIERAIKEVEGDLSSSGLNHNASLRWLAVKALEGDRSVYGAFLDKGILSEADLYYYKSEIQNSKF